MPFKKVEVTLKFPKCLHLEKLLLVYVIVLLMSYNFCNHNSFISLKIAVIFKVHKVAPPCVYIYVYVIKTLPNIFDRDLHSSNPRTSRTRFDPLAVYNTGITYKDLNTNLKTQKKSFQTDLSHNNICVNLIFKKILIFSIFTKSRSNFIFNKKDLFIGILLEYILCK